MMLDVTMQAPEEEPRPKRPSFLSRLLLVLMIMLVTIIVLGRTMFRLRNVYVVGNVTKTAEEVAQASKLRLGDNMLTIDEAIVEENINSDASMVFLRLERAYPNTVYIYITERRKAAVLQWLGIQYTIDEQGVVMTESNSLLLPENLPEAKGFQITRTHQGKMLEVKDDRQLTAYRKIMSELRLQMFQHQVKSIVVSDPDMLYFTANSGIMVKLGNDSHLRAKICAARTDLAYLMELGASSGVLNVSIPEDAKYTPD